MIVTIFLIKKSSDVLLRRFFFLCSLMAVRKKLVCITAPNWLVWLTMVISTLCFLALAVDNCKCLQFIHR